MSLSLVNIGLGHYLSSQAMFGTSLVLVMSLSGWISSRFESLFDRVILDSAVG